MIILMPRYQRRVGVQPPAVLRHQYGSVHTMVLFQHVQSTEGPALQAEHAESSQDRRDVQSRDAAPCLLRGAPCLFVESMYPLVPPSSLRCIK